MKHINSNEKAIILHAMCKYKTGSFLPKSVVPIRIIHVCKMSKEVHEQPAEG